MNIVDLDAEIVWMCIRSYRDFLSLTSTCKHFRDLLNDETKVAVLHEKHLKSIDLAMRKLSIQKHLLLSRNVEFMNYYADLLKDGHTIFVVDKSPMHKFIKRKGYVSCYSLHKIVTIDKWPSNSSVNDKIFLLKNRKNDTVARLLSVFETLEDVYLNMMRSIFNHGIVDADYILAKAEEDKGKITYINKACKCVRVHLICDNINSLTIKRRVQTFIRKLERCLSPTEWMLPVNSF